jgi:hypothetical protein
MFGILAFLFLFGSGNVFAQTAGYWTSGTPSNFVPSTNHIYINLDNDGDVILSGVAGSTAEQWVVEFQSRVRALTAINPAKQQAYSGFTATWNGTNAVFTSGSTGAGSSVVVPSGYGGFFPGFPPGGTGGESGSSFVGGGGGPVGGGSGGSALSDSFSTSSSPITSDIFIGGTFIVALFAMMLLYRQIKTVVQGA